jgi:ubiquinone/menaquinone biosynthesis C-methylase UbiE
MKMPLERVLEPEVMDSPEEARDYDAMDHAAVNATFCEDLLSYGAHGSPGSQAAVGPRVLDVGTGTALIPVELCRRAPWVHVVAIDLANHMLAVARENVARAGLQDRVMLELVDAKKMPFDASSFGAVVSNSIIHHIPEPGDVLAEIHRVTASGGLVFIRDLARPDSEEEVDRLVGLYAGEPPADAGKKAAFEHQRELFRASLRAALTVPEVAELARSAGMNGDVVRMTSDRHWTLAFRKP